MYSVKESHSESEFYYPEKTENNEIYDENEVLSTLKKIKIGTNAYMWIPHGVHMSILV